tara:strand:+ start:14691 stop:15440 length:750 start_codon:yes stop_codon:yes gene_type:complete
MAWRFPKHRVSNNSVIEIDDINENFRAVVEEGSGELNEHNWKAASWSNRLTDLSDGVGVRVANFETIVDPTDNPLAGGSTSLRIENEPNWQRLGPLRTVTTTGADFWVLASFAARLPWYRATFTDGTNLNTTEAAYGAMFALRVDGNVLTQSIVGSGDIQNDQMETQQYLPSPQGIGLLCFNSPAITSTHAAIVVEATIELAPGQHTIELVAMPPKRDLSDFTESTVVTPQRYVKSITNRELIIIELRR